MPGPPPKRAGVRQRWAKRPELGIVPSEGEPERLIPKAPRGLLAASRAIWDGFWSSPVALAVDRQSDMHRVNRWITAVDEYERCMPVLRKTRLVKGSMGQPVLNPLASYLAQVEANLKAAESDLGLTPMARLKLGVTFGQAKLTAAELNRQLEASEPEPGEPEAWEAEWTEAT
jgi:P27 family predicted phage terminase small subunit